MENTRKSQAIIVGPQGLNFNLATRYMPHQCVAIGYSFSSPGPVEMNSIAFIHFMFARCGCVPVY